MTLRVRGDNLTADFIGTAPQAPSAINSPLAYTQSAVYLTVRSIMPPEVPNSAGFFRPLQVNAPEGTLVNPSFPAAVGAMGVTGYRLVDTVFGALSQAAPHQVRAASEGGSTRCTFDASQDGQRRILSEAIVGAWGGHPTMDGVDGIANVAGNMANAPVEAVESAFPVLVEAYGFAPDSEGPGTFRGGLGIRRQFRLLAPNGGLLQIRSGRASAPPWGLHGGASGTPCQNVLNPGGPQEQTLRGNETLHIPSDTVYVHVTPGAGGFGPPEARPVDLVAQDVRDGKVSPQRAREVYRVAVSDVGVVDADETRRLRANRSVGN